MNRSIQMFLLLNMLMFGLMGCSAGPSVDPAALASGESVTVHGHELRIVTVSRPGMNDANNSATVKGVVGPNNRWLMKPSRYYRLTIVGQYIYGKAFDDKLLERRRLTQEGSSLHVSEAESTPFWLIKPVNQSAEPGEIAGKAYLPREYRNFPTSMVFVDSLGEEVRRAEFNKRYEEFWPIGDGFLVTEQYKPPVLWNSRGETVSPPLLDIHRVRYHGGGIDTFAVPLDDGYWLPLSPVVGVPRGEAKLLGYKPFHQFRKPDRLVIYHWWKEYEIDGQKLYGYGSPNLDEESGPLWSEIQVIDTRREFGVEEGLFMVGKLAKTGRYQVYQLGDRNERPLKDGRVVARYQQASSKDAALAPLLAKVEDRLQLEAARERRYKERLVQAQRNRALDRELQAKWRAEREAKERRWKAEFEQAMAERDRRKAEGRALALEGDYLGRYRLAFPLGVSSAEWRKAYHAATDPSLKKKLLARYRATNAAEIKRQRDMAQEAERLRNQPSWGQVMQAGAAAYRAAQQRKSEAAYSQARKRYIESLRDWTYGRQNWRPAEP